MIQELINFTNEISKSNPEVFLLNKKPNEGLHIFVELDGEGKWSNNPPTFKVDYDFYDGKSELSSLLHEFMQYEDYSKRVGTTMNKALDKKKQIFSCSPFVINFKKQSFTNDKLDGLGYEKIIKLFLFYFDNARTICLDKEDESTIQLSKAFEQICIEVLQNIGLFLMQQIQKDGTETFVSIFETMKDAFYISIYLKNIPLEKYKQAHESYLKQKLFNTNEYNSTGKENEISDNTFGISSFLNGLNSKKTFLEHKTASMYRGISSRISAKDAVALNNFEILLSNKSLPNPLPIFIDKDEFTTNIAIIKLFNQVGDKLTYSQILKHICDDDNKNLSNYYLLNMIKGEVKDFDFVPLFRYKMENHEKTCDVLNFFEVKQEKEIEPTITVRTIFGFESKIVHVIFNNSLVKIKNDIMSVNYFGDIDPIYVSGGDLVYQMIMKYRQAFYDYIYKSKEDAITCLMFDDIMYNTLIADLREDELKEGKYHSRETNIKKRLNIWFSLYDYFDLHNLPNKKNMASRIPELMNHVRSIANDSSAHLSEDPAEFGFAAGQVIYYLLTKSVANNKTYAMLEPILQKHTVAQVQEAITEMIKTYKHEIDLGKGRFANLAKDVLTFYTNDDMKKYQRFLLAGCFAPSVIFEQKTKTVDDAVEIQ
jgi:CRISPR-associated protein Csh1